MKDINVWLQGTSKAEQALASLACLALILLGGIEIGRTLYQAAHRFPAPKGALAIKS
jgi:hypothetical protein